MFIFWSVFLLRVSSYPCRYLLARRFSLDEHEIKLLVPSVLEPREVPVGGQEHRVPRGDRLDKARAMVRLRARGKDRVKGKDNDKVKD